VKERYGKEFYREIGEKGGGAVKERYGAEFYSEIGKRGGEVVKLERGSEYYSTIGRKGGESRAAESVRTLAPQPDESEENESPETQVSTTA
jgi:general stress protein YciG